MRRERARRRRFAGFGAVFLTLPLVIVVQSKPAAAVVPSCTTVTGTLTFSPPLPAYGDPTMVASTLTGTETFSGCTGLGVTSGTATFTASSVDPPTNCDNRFQGNGAAGNEIGTTVITWNTGQTTTASGFFPGGDSKIVAGLFAGYSLTEGPPHSFTQGPPGYCATPLTTLTVSLNGPLLFTTSGGFDACAAPDPCKRHAATKATASAPGLDVTVTGTPADGAGSIKLKIAPGSLQCPKVPPAVRPVATLTPTGFAKADRLTVIARLPITSATSAEQVCFTSTAPFRSQSSPKTPKAGPALLLDCAKTGGVPPCVRSRSQVGSDLLVTFVIPGRDPRFCIVLPSGSQVWAMGSGIGRVGRPYSAQLRTTGGRSPFSWSIVSGSLPNGCTLNRTTGKITGTPTRRDSFTAVVKATDSSTPRKTARLTLPIKIT